MSTLLAGLFARRRSRLLATALFGVVAVQRGEPAAQAQPAAAAKKTPVKPKQKTPEWHGEAAPREVVPGEKVLAALIELGTTRMSAGRYDEALKAFTDAVLRAPLEPKPLYLRGACYQKMNRLREAETDFRAALKLDPTGADDQSVKVRAELGAVLTDSGRAASALLPVVVARHLLGDVVGTVLRAGVVVVGHQPQPHGGLLQCVSHFNPLINCGSHCNVPMVAALSRHSSCDTHRRAR